MSVSITFLVDEIKLLFLLIFIWKDFFVGNFDGHFIFFHLEFVVESEWLLFWVEYNHKNVFHEIKIFHLQTFIKWQKLFDDFYLLNVFVTHFEISNHLRKRKKNCSLNMILLSICSICQKRVRIGCFVSNVTWWNFKCF